MTNITPITGESNVGRVEPRRSDDRPGTTAPTALGRGADRVEVSDEARLLGKLGTARQRLESGELGNLASMLARLRGEPTFRADLVSEVKAKLDDPAYLTDEKLDAALDAVIDDLSE